MSNSKGSAKTKLRWSLFPHGNKGITPIIAIILLLMMTVAIAGSAFFWTSRIQNQMQGGVESYQNTLLTQMASSVKVFDADCSDSDCNNLTIFFQNIGSSKIPTKKCCDWPTTTWILKDSDQTAVCATNWSIPTGGSPFLSTNCLEGCGEDINVGEIRKVVLNTTDTVCDISNDTLYPGGTVYSFTVDFSGKTTTSGSFIKPG
jgi:flagellin-like protein